MNDLRLVLIDLYRLVVLSVRGVSWVARQMGRKFWALLAVVPLGIVIVSIALAVSTVHPTAGAAALFVGVGVVILALAGLIADASKTTA